MVLEKQKKTARMKGYITLGSAIVTGILWFKTTWFLGLIGTGVTIFLGYDWLRYRGKWGLKF